MANLSGVVQQLKKAHAEAQGEVKRLGAALAALGNLTVRRPGGKRVPYRLLLEGRSALRRKRDGQRGVPTLKEVPRDLSGKCRQQVVGKSQPLSAQGGRR